MIAQPSSDGLSPAAGCPPTGYASVSWPDGSETGSLPVAGAGVGPDLEQVEDALVGVDLGGDVQRRVIHAVNKIGPGTGGQERAELLLPVSTTKAPDRQRAIG